MACVPPSPSLPPDAPSQLGTSPELVAGWNAARALCAVASLLVRAENEGVRLHALKFIETAVLLHTAALGTHADDAGVAQGVQPLKPNSLLSASELNRDLRTYLGAQTWRRLRSAPARSPPRPARLDELQACASRSHSGPFSLVLVSVLATLARRRLPLSGELLPPLLAIADAAAASAPATSQTASLSHALKGACVQLLRSGPPAEWQGRIVAALRALGHEEAASSALRQLERSLKRERAEPAPREADAADSDDDTSLVFPEAKRPRGGVGDDPPPTDPELVRRVVSAAAALAAGGDLATLATFVAQLTPAVLADVVLHTLAHLAPAPPPDTGAPQPGGAGRLVDLLRAEPAEAPPEDAEPEPVQPAQPAPVVAVPLTSEQRGEQRRAAFERMLRVEGRSLVTGAWPPCVPDSPLTPRAAAGAQPLRHALLPRILLSLGDAQAERTFLSHLAEDWAGRGGHALLLQWLFCCFATTLGEGARAGPQAYESALLSSVRALVDRLPGASGRGVPLPAQLTPLSRSPSARPAAFLRGCARTAPRPPGRAGGPVQPGWRRPGGADAGPGDAERDCGGPAGGARSQPGARAAMHGAPRRRAAQQGDPHGGEPAAPAELRSRAH